MKLNTVNVIETVDGNVIGIRSFSDNEAGNKEAEALFITCIKEQIETSLPEEHASAALDNGYYTTNNYTIFLAHST